MALLEIAGVLDFYSFFVDGVFGSFFLAVIGLALVMFIILAWLGKCSMYTFTWYVLLYICAMCMGYAPMFGFLITLIILVSFMLSWRSYIEAQR